MGYASIEIVPVVTASSAYTVLDVLFENTSFELPSKGCKIISLFAYDKGAGLADGDMFDLFFFRDNVANLGTMDATANISEADFKSNRPLGMCRLIHEENEIHNEIDNLEFMQGAGVNLVSLTARPVSELGLVLQGDTSTGVGNTCYVSGVINTGTPTFAAVDDLVIVLGIEY